MEKISRFIYTRSKVIFLIVGLLNIISLVSFINFKFSTDYLAFFKGTNEEALVYDQLAEKYTGIETVQILISSDNGQQLTEEENLLAIASYLERLRQVEGVTFANSFLPSKITTSHGLRDLDSDFISSNYSTVQTLLTKSTVNQDLLSENKQLTVVTVGLSEEVNPEETVQRIEEIPIDAELSLQYAGNTVITTSLLDYLIKLILTLPPGAIILLLAVFYFSIRNIKFTLFSMLPAAFGALWTFGTLFIIGKEISIITVLAPVFIIVIGSADGLHFTTHYLDNAKRLDNKQKLIEHTLKMVGIPIIMTSLTTMAGFLSLAFTDIVPMRDLGIATALGIFYAGLISFFFLPALMTKVEIPEKIATTTQHPFVHLLKRWVKYRRTIITIFLIIIMFFAAYIPKLDVISDQLYFYKDNSKIVQTFNTIEEHFASPIPLVGEYYLPDAGIYDVNEAKEILELERELEKQQGIVSVTSIYDFIQNGNYILTGYSFYPEKDLAIEIIDALEKEMNFDTKQWLAADGAKFMISTKGLTEGEQAEFAKSLADNPHIRTITGMPILFNDMNQLLVEGQIQSIIIALILVFIMLLISFRNLKNTLVGMIPLVVTLISLFGFLAASNINLNLSTVMMASIAIGVGIDYSIHFISIMSQYQKSGEANFIDKTIDTVAKPIITNAFGLAIGLTVYVLSPFKIHSQLSAIIWVSMLVSSMAALLLIPQFYRNGIAKTQQEK